MLKRKRGQTLRSYKKSKKLDIVAFDACNMSMIELASELQAYADFMIASQEEVPDASFPYEDLLKLRLRTLPSLRP